MRLAYFISPHGFGHASRACAVMNEIGRLEPSASFDIYTTVPDWFFKDSLTATYDYRTAKVDLGMVQKTAVEEDPRATLIELKKFLPFDSRWVEDLARRLRDRGVLGVLCDIAPLGLEVAEAAGIPSFLVDNFSWDWIYRAYLEKEPGLALYADFLEQRLGKARKRYRASPFCGVVRHQDVAVNPIARHHRLAPKVTREQLGIPSGASMVLVSMGGINWDWGGANQIETVEHQENLWFVVPGGKGAPERRPGLIRLPHHSSFYHPDLMAAADLVVGKLGYSTVAEAWLTGTRFAWVKRPGFPESAVLSRWVRQHLCSVEVDSERLFGLRWQGLFQKVLNQELLPETRKSGQNEVAQSVLSQLIR